MKFVSYQQVAPAGREAVNMLQHKNQGLIHEQGIITRITT
jgi:hypothetical protein